MPVYLDPIKKTYNISYYLNGKKKFKRTKIKNKQQALKFEKELKSQNVNLKFHELYNKFINYYINIYSENTIAKYEYIYKNQLVDLYYYNIKDININILLNLQIKLLKKYSNSRINTIFSCIRTILNFGLKFYGLKNNPAKLIDNLKVNDNNDVGDNYITYDEFRIFIIYVNDFKYFLIFLTLFFYGLRISELTALKVNDFYNKLMRIDESRLAKVPKRLKGKKKLKSTKNNKIEYIRLADWYWNLIKKYIEINDLDSDDYIFGNRDKALSETTYRRNHNKYFKLSGIKRITPHGFRHSCASFYLSKGVDIVYVSRLLRHESIDVTIKYYIHFYKKDLDKIVQIVNESEIIFS